MLEVEQLELVVQQLYEMALNRLLIFQNLLQLIILLVGLGLAYAIFHKFEEKILNQISRLKLNNSLVDKEQLKKILDKTLLPFIYLTLLWIYILITLIPDWPTGIINIVTNVLIAWIIINNASILLHNKSWARLIGIIIWTGVSLKILGIYSETLELLDSLAFKSGNIRISILMLIKGTIIISVLIWITRKLTVFTEKRIKKLSTLTPSIKVLLSKFTNFLLFFIAILITLSSLGIDLTAFAVLGGAVGVGIGFGLQKVVSNFISGIIILLDKSVKPGDVIEINNVYGRITSLSSRFISVVTRSGKEFLIPNEDFITKNVINWSYSDTKVRVDLEVGVSYNSDLQLVRKLMLEAVDKPRVEKYPEPKCLLTEFADSSVNLALRFWIKDPENGIDNIKSDILFTIWELFQEHNIEIPYPQQDLYIKEIKTEHPKKMENTVQTEDGQQHYQEKQTKKEPRKTGDYPH